MEVKPQRNGQGAIAPDPDSNPLGRPGSARDPLLDRAERAAALLRAMAHPQRLRVLCLLSEGERSVGELNAEVPLSQSALSQHLARLRRLQLVATRKAAQTVFYRLEPGVVRDLIEVLRAAA